MPVQLGTRPNPRHFKPVERGPPSPWQRHPCKPQPVWRPVPGALLPEETKGLTTGDGLAAGRSDSDPERATLPCPPRDSAMEPVLKRSHMEQPQRCDCSRHMPQEPLKLFQWCRCPALTYSSSSTPTEHFPA